MGKVTPIGIAGAAVAAVAVAGVLLLGHGTSSANVAPAAPIAVRAAFDPPVVQFGDPVTARLVILLDRGAVRAQTLRIASGLAPLTPLAAPTTTRTVSGRLETVTITQRLSCLTDPCIAHSLKFPPVRVTVSGRQATTRWRPLQVKGRVDAADLAASSPPFVADTAPGTPTYAVSPSATAKVLDVVAALAAAGAVALLTWQALMRGRRTRRTPAGDELARALRLARESEQRDVPDRRRALGLLARLLDGGLGRAASELAWSQPQPEPETVDELVKRVDEEPAA